jgi:broad specificity phosphatase PhoE
MPLSQPAKKVTRLLLVRHGSTNLTEENRFSGSIGVELSKDGREQAARLGERLEDLEIDAFYSSDMSRARDTATIVAKPHGEAVIERDELREISHGHWEGLSRKEVEERFGEEYAAWEADPFTMAPQGGEAGITVLARALPVIRKIVVDHAGRTVLIVSHKATLRLLLSSLLGFDARGYRDRLDQAPACLNVVDFMDPVHARLMLFNDTSHYADAPRRGEAHLSKVWDKVGDSP